MISLPPASSEFTSEAVWAVVGAVLDELDLLDELELVDTAQGGVGAAVPVVVEEAPPLLEVDALPPSSWAPMAALLLAAL